MSLTIIIVNWNAGELLIRCLQSIRASLTSFPVKVIVVDNDSSDGSREQAQRDFPEFSIFNSGSNVGFGRANNLARPMVDTSLVLFLNPDTELKPDTLERMVHLMQTHTDIGAASCMMRYPNGLVQEQGLQWFPTPWTVLIEALLPSRKRNVLFNRLLPTIDPLHAGYVRKIYGGFIMARKEVLDRAGWFDGRYFMYAEDVDLCRTILNLGSKLYYSAEAEIMHVAGGTSAKAPSGFSILMKHESVGKYMRKYHGSAGTAVYRISVLTGALIRFLALLPLQFISGSEEVSRNSAAGSLVKQRFALLWALGLKKPAIAKFRIAPEMKGVQSQLREHAR